MSALLPVLSALSGHGWLTESYWRNEILAASSAAKKWRNGWREAGTVPLLALGEGAA